MEVDVRSMRRDDWPEVSAIYQAGIDSNLATFRTRCPSFEEWDATHLRIGRLVAVVGETVAGWTALSPVSSSCAYTGVAEVSVYVAPERHGCGIGTALLAALDDAAEREGIWTLHASIMQNNAASIRLHEKCGFRLIGYRERIGKDRDGVWRNTVLMERRNTLE